MMVSRVAGAWLWTLGCLTAPLAAQAPFVNSHPYAGVSTPGAIGARQLTRGGPLAGYMQPVELRAPEGAQISLAMAGHFDPASKSPRLVGLHIASVYRLQVTSIPNHPGDEVFPTVELVDRLYPPVGQELKYPVPIHITQDDLEQALAGKFVTRVIYVEDPKNALAAATTRKDQSWFDVGVDENPLQVADRLGRPMAILRLGGRLPDTKGPDDEFMYGSPEWMPYELPVEGEPASAVKAQRAALQTPARVANGPKTIPVVRAIHRREITTQPTAPKMIRTSTSDTGRSNPLR